MLQFCGYYQLGFIRLLHSFSHVLNDAVILLLHPLCKNVTHSLGVITAICAKCVLCATGCNSKIISRTLGSWPPELCILIERCSSCIGEKICLMMVYRLLLDFLFQG